MINRCKAERASAAEARDFEIDIWCLDGPNRRPHRSYTDAVLPGMEHLLPVHNDLKLGRTWDNIDGIAVFAEELKLI
jgi:hypothetical protein